MGPTDHVRNPDIVDDFDPELLHERGRRRLGSKTKLERVNPPKEGFNLDIHEI